MVGFFAELSLKVGSASNSYQVLPNKQRLPTLTLFLPLQVHGLWLGFFAELSLKVGYETMEVLLSHWKSVMTLINL